MPKFSTIVDEILQLLGEAEGSTPGDDGGEETPTVTIRVQTETPKEEARSGTEDDLAAEALKLKTSYQKRLVSGPEGIRTGQTNRLSPLRSAFLYNYSGAMDLDRLDSIKNKFETLLKAYTEVAAEIARAKELANRVAALASVPGAPPEDVVELGKAHVLAEAAVNKADSAEKLAAAEKLVSPLFELHGTAADKVRARNEKKAQIIQDAAEIHDLPETELNTFQSKREEVSSALGTTPLTDAALLTAETALVALRQAHQAAEKEAMNLRQLRAGFADEAQKMRARVDALTEKLAKAKKKQTADALKALGEADKLLLVTATKAQTAQFPAKLAEVKVAMMGVLASNLAERNDAGVASGKFLSDELDQLRAEAKKLPQFLPVDDDYAAAAQKLILAAEQNVKLGGHKASQARVDVGKLGEVIALWRNSVGVNGILLGQRKTAAAAKLAPKDPNDVSVAFGAALTTIRDKADKSLQKPLKEINVIEVEQIVEPFPALLAKATVDAEAWGRVTAAKKTLATGDALTNVIAAARPPAKKELTKARDFADARAALTDMDRDMTRTAAMFEALVLRMQEVKSEGSFSAADKTPFNEIDDKQRELAFNLCGPALIGAMTPAAKTELNKVLKSDGKAIEDLAEQAFGGNPKVFQKVLTDCGAEGLATIARALAGGTGTAAREALDGLIEKGGLGANPAILAQLIGDPPKSTDTVEVATAKRLRQEKNAAGLKSLAENFAGEEGQAAMGTLMGDCALGTSPGALASLMQEGGFDGNGAELRDFADAFIGDDDQAKAARAGFGRIVKTGGVAEHPKVLGPLAKQTGAEGVKQIGAAFTKPEDCANLKGLLDSGGMSGDTHLPGKKHEHPDTLAKVFVDGLCSDGTKLKHFAKAFSGGPKQAQAKGMLDAWNEYPEGHQDLRQPGQQIAQVLGRMTGSPEGQISKLQTQFTENIHTKVPTAKRASAYRFAPDLASQTAPTSLAPPGNMPDGFLLDSSSQGQSLCRRHVAKYFSRATMNFQNTLWPVGTDQAKLTGYLGNAIANAGAMPKDNSTTSNIGSGKQVEFATKTYDLGVTYKVNHLHPGGGWPQGADPNEVVDFRNTELSGMLDAVGVV